MKTWIDPGIGFPVYAEKTVKESGAVKEFTSYGVRQEQGQWSAHQIEAKIRGQAGSTLLIIDRGSAKANLTIADFSPGRAHALLGDSCTPPFGSLRSPLVFISAGVLYQLLGSCRDRRVYTREGRWVTIGNRASLYLFEMGLGEPTVLFEAGIGATHLNWRSIQEAIAQLSCTVSYDRCGLGWSSRCRSARTPGNIAEELHQMLNRAGVKPPYVLVGHSFGGLVMRRYALLYPGEVAGVVLIDPMRCEEWPPLDPSKQSQLDLGRKLIRYAMPVARCGLARLLVSLLFCRAAKSPSRLPAPPEPTAATCWTGSRPK